MLEDFSYASWSGTPVPFSISGLLLCIWWRYTFPLSLSFIVSWTCLNKVSSCPLPNCYNISFSFSSSLIELFDASSFMLANGEFLKPGDGYSGKGIVRWVVICYLGLLSNLPYRAIKFRRASFCLRLISLFLVFKTLSGMFERTLWFIPDSSASILELSVLMYLFRISSWVEFKSWSVGSLWA